MAWPTKHGLARTPTYRAWYLMKHRCTTASKDAKNYANRGITVCEEWAVFENFLRDMGEKPIGTSIDRIDNDKGYCKENCRWATTQQQAENKRGVRRIEWNGKTYTLTALAREVGIPVKTLSYRLDTGMRVDQAITAKARSFRRMEK